MVIGRVSFGFVFQFWSNFFYFNLCC